MTRPVRLGAVSYLNVRPLVFGLADRPDLVTLRFDVPSVCARLLADGAIDLGMVPSIAYGDRPGDRIVPGVCIGSEGPVASVAIFTRRPMQAVRTLALDASSRTSAVLAQILCARQFGIAPACTVHPPELGAMLAAADAALLIGDQALFADHRAHDADKIDLGAAWTELTGLPFVWAFWAGAPGAADAEVVALLRESAERGMAESDRLADVYCPDDPARQMIARRYLRENLMFRLTPRAQAGLDAFYREAAALGLIGDRPTPAFY